MSIVNFMEMSVKAEVARRRHHGHPVQSVCWCPLCEADVISLTLSMLPPSYGRWHSAAFSEARRKNGTVSPAVSEAIETVARHPRHPRGEGVAGRHRVRIVDFGLEEGARLVRESAPSTGSCDCYHCRADTLALALNRVRPRFGVYVDGRDRLPEEARDLLRTALGDAVREATRAVGLTPRH